MGEKMQVSIGNTIEIRNPSADIISWCKKNLMLPNPEYQKKVRMNLWLGGTPKELCLYERRGKTLILPYGVLARIVPLLGDIEKNRSFSPVMTIDFRSTIPLYDYQREAVSSMMWYGYGILQSPAGSGKTQMGIALITKLGLRALWITHTTDLLKQSKERAEEYIEPSLIGTITEGKVNIGVGLTFATVQTLSRLDLPRYRDCWDVIVVDECHRCSGTPTAMTQFYKVLNNLAARYKFGLSATVHRSDGTIEATYALLGDVVHIVPETAVADRVMKVGIKRWYTGTRISPACLNTDGTLNYTRLITWLCEDFDRNHIISNVIVSNSEHPSLILSDRLSHLETLISLLPCEMQDRAVMISGKMTSKKDKEKREQAIKDMQDGKKLYLFATYSLAKEGLDIPRLERLYLATPQKDYAVVAQSIGRIARTHECKAPPICYDFIDDIGYLVNAFKKRCSTYRKIGCYFVEEGEP